MENDLELDPMKCVERGFKRGVAIERAAALRRVCKALGKCAEHEVLSTSHHPDCERIREAFRKADIRGMDYLQV